MWACNRALSLDPEACKQLKDNFQMFFLFSFWNFVWTFFPISGKLDILEMGEDWDERKVQNEFFPQSSYNKMWMLCREKITRRWESWTWTWIALGELDMLWVGKWKNSFDSLWMSFVIAKKITPDSRAEKKSHKNLFCRGVFSYYIFPFVVTPFLFSQGKTPQSEILSRKWEPYLYVKHRERKKHSQFMAHEVD